VHRASIVVHGGVGISGDEANPEALGGVQEAARRGRDLLQRGGSALQAVLEAVRTLEDDPAFNAGTGSALTSDGTVETDASVMWGKDLTAGGVAVLSGFRNPVLVAEAVRGETPHVLLAGDGAHRFALKRGFLAVDPETMVTPAQRAKWRAAQGQFPPKPEKLGTVGAVACDRDGHVAAATSTGGLFLKMPGRVGDTPIIGGGTYADDEAGAASCTGKGEAILKVSLAKMAVDQLRAGRPAQAAAEAAIAEFTRRTASEAGLILVDMSGELGVAFNTLRMSRASWTTGAAEPSASIEVLR
jgi:L-asparaginase / beta-aspartyl-peptidase